MPSHLDEEYRHPRQEVPRPQPGEVTAHERLTWAGLIAGAPVYDTRLQTIPAAQLKVGDLIATPLGGPEVEVTGITTVGDAVADPFLRWPWSDPDDLLVEARHGGVAPFPRSREVQVRRQVAECEPVLTAAERLHRAAGEVVAAWAESVDYVRHATATARLQRAVDALEAAARVGGSTEGTGSGG